MFLFFCLPAPSGLYGTMWIKLLLALCPSNCIILQKDGNDSEGASFRATEVFIWTLLSWKQVSFTEHTSNIMVKTSTRGTTPMPSILSCAIHKLVAAGWEIDCDLSSLALPYLWSTHMVLGKTCNLLKSLFPYEQVRIISPPFPPILDLLGKSKDMIDVKEHFGN